MRIMILLLSCAIYGMTATTPPSVKIVVNNTTKRFLKANVFTNSDRSAKATMYLQPSSCDTLFLHNDEISAIEYNFGNKTYLVEECGPYTTHGGYCFEVNYELYEKADIIKLDQEELLEGLHLPDWSLSGMLSPHEAPSFSEVIDYDLFVNGVRKDNCKNGYMSMPIINDDTAVININGNGILSRICSCQIKITGDSLTQLISGKGKVNVHLDGGYEAIMSVTGHYTSPYHFDGAFGESWVIILSWTHNGDEHEVRCTPSVMPYKISERRKAMNRSREKFMESFWGE